jgi:RNA polymerase sigma-70 factor (ECF subfamily)
LQTVIEKEEVEILAKAISQLSSEQQQVIILRFIEGFSHREVAQILGKKEGACRMIQYRALSSLQQIWTVLEA